MTNFYIKCIIKTDKGTKDNIVLKYYINIACYNIL